MSTKQNRLSFESVGTSVIVIDNNLKTALKIFKQEVKNSGKIENLYKKMEYKKPSEKRKELKNKALFKNKNRILT